MVLAKYCSCKALSSSALLRIPMQPADWAVNYQETKVEKRSACNLVAFMADPKG